MVGQYVNGEYPFWLGEWGTDAASILIPFGLRNVVEAWVMLDGQPLTGQYHPYLGGRDTHNPYTSRLLPITAVYREGITLALRALGLPSGEGTILLS